MTEEALQIDFRPQPRGIAVVTSAPISAIADHGNYSAFQDLIDGYASSFARVHVISPSGESPVKPDKSHRVTWHSGPGWLSPTNGLLWSVATNRKSLREVELVRTFGPKAGIAGKVLARTTKSPLIASSDDLIGNMWRDLDGWRSTPIKLANKIGLMRANMLTANLDWELEFLSDYGYKNDLLIGKPGFATDVFTTVGTTDPARHPVVLWTGSIATDDLMMLVEESARATQRMIENVEFVIVGTGERVEKLKEDVDERNLPITVAALDQSEPLVDLIELTWVCVTTPNNGIPGGLAMLAASAGIPLVSLGELEETQGFKNQLNYVGVEAENPESVAYGLQLLRRWTDWSLRIGVAGQRVVEDQYSTKAVALREGEQLVRIARGEQAEFSAGPLLRDLKPYTSPAEGEVPSLFNENEEQNVVLDSVAEDSADEEGDEDLAAGFDLVAAALEDVSNMGSQTVSTVEMIGDSTSDESSNEASDSGEMDQDAISALFSNADSPDEPVESSSDDGQLDQDAISALFDSETPDSTPAVEEASTSDSDDLDQDAITALFDSSTDSETDSDDSGDSDDPMDQGAISALFASQESEPEVPSDEVNEEGGEENEPDSEEITLVEFGSVELPESESADLDWEPEPVEVFDLPEPETGTGDLDQHAITALFAENNTPNEPEEPDEIEVQDEPNIELGTDQFLEQAEEIEEDVVSAILDAKTDQALPLVEVTDVEDSDVDLPSVNVIQVNDDIEAVTDEEELIDDLEVDDIDPDLIASILEGKDVDPSL